MCKIELYLPFIIETCGHGIDQFFSRSSRVGVIIGGCSESTTDDKAAVLILTGVEIDPGNRMVKQRRQFLSMGKQTQ